MRNYSKTKLTNKKATKLEDNFNKENFKLT